MEDKKNFKEIAEKIRDKLSRENLPSKSIPYPANSNLFINEKAGVAVIGIQYTAGDIITHSYSTIHVLKKDGSLEKVLGYKTFTNEKMFPTEILEDGTGFKYILEYKSRKFNKETYNF